MATTAYPVNHALAQKIWGQGLLVEAIAATKVGQFLGTGSDALLVQRTELQKNKGDRVRIGLRDQLSGDGVSGDDTLEGNEEALTTYSDNIFIDQLRHAVRSAGVMSEQRVPFDVRDEALDGLKDWWSERLDFGFANQLTGNVVQTNTKYTGMQAVITADANHLIRANAADAADLSATTTNRMNLNLIDQCKELAVAPTAAASRIIRPIKYMGDDYYCLFLHPYQVRDMRANTAAGQWTDIQLAAMNGGQIKDNPIFTGSLGVYNGVVLHEWNRLPKAISNANAAVANTKRAVFCGAQAAAIAFGQEYSEKKMSWNEALFDYGNQLGVEAGLIHGIKKLVFNSNDIGTIALDTYTTTDGLY
jgi:N4-gp56 family major capsid protein